MTRYSKEFKDNIIKQGERDYLFTVAGTDVYQVFVKFDDQGEITQTGCDCPYDFGPICKHNRKYCNQ
ncbi:SWIM zinc finger domain-containing protein [Acetobacterium sp.]|uniref:SWIM zinc finger family protein n=1 Tax=Acetobacterium sp. TaxID=1872094 RepID=UPI003594138C